MSWRTLLISSISKLEFSNNYLIVRNQETSKILIDEIDSLIIESNAVCLTVQLLTELVRRKVKVIFCDEDHNPYYELTCYRDNCNSSSCINKQINWHSKVGEILWKEIIKVKIANQSRLLDSQGFSSEAKKLIEYIEQVENADVTNREGHAAKVYFNKIFGKEFSRNNESNINAMLNYGYSILLSTINKEIIKHGYLTQLGIHHKNQYNPFNLSSDLIEPFRVYVDEYVLNHSDLKLKDAKLDLIDILNKYVEVNQKQTKLKNAITLFIESIIRSLNNDEIDVVLPNYGI